MIDFNLKQQMRRRFGSSLYVRLRRFLYLYYGIFYRHDLVSLGKAFNSDKATFHSYAARYQSHFSALKMRSMNILEIGIGGYENSMSGGESLRMWKSYFPRSRIYGIDIHDKSLHNETRIKTFVGSQVDETFLLDVVDQIGELDIIIDDGSHVNEHVIKTFSVLFPFLKMGGIYAIEDLQTSYWDDGLGGWGGSRDLQAPHTSMNFLKRLVDGLNHREFLDPSYQATYCDKNISSLHFYHNLAFIFKDVNDDPSNRHQFTSY